MIRVAQGEAVRQKKRAIKAEAERDVLAQALAKVTRSCPADWYEYAKRDVVEQRELETKMEKLKPCPFCGETPELQYYEYPDRGPGEADGYYYIQCERPCTNEYSAHAVEKLLKEWNTRPIEDALRAQLEAYKELAEAREEHRCIVAGLLVSMFDALDRGDMQMHGAEQATRRANETKARIEAARAKVQELEESMATKNCLSCRFEPKWRPVAGECWKQGICGNGLHSRVPACCVKAVIIWRPADGRRGDQLYVQAPRNQFKKITSCAAWWAKE